MDEKTALTNAITKALAYQENGGSLDAHKITAGKTGELKSIFQFEPGTWKGYAKEYLGDEKAPVTPDNETLVVTKQVRKWIDKGYTAKQIASMWNAGDSEPDAYTGKFSNGSPSVRVNKKYDVKFNVPAYATNVERYAQKFYKENSGATQPDASAQPTPSATPSTPPNPQPIAAHIPSGEGLMQLARNAVSSVSAPGQ